ncbi:hypothetical protein CYL21_4834 [Plasmodium falciparum NF54]|uniref:Uncharacterized protein n=2 Tax=Plasmodium falciparum TaxID=5833 RepID=Q8I5Z6_PLAF7|nr:conserved Plasmodium protein, unknown function [Plasmodium falciparum 3D7]KAF4327340.1 hypothetical protein CYL21_4834 [Plasmodium falciparum NF54]PKC48202.1 hypothetical protein CK202_1607 [Plasmodium falciparum NF54]CZT99211.1 conserved Plasmodium protein, unknown function [Plasmodium falciparum 3D7]|eukprot:XP_001350458.1 probable protein, unknown function [Plasmodium falciparum 3D7]
MFQALSYTEKMKIKFWCLLFAYVISFVSTTYTKINRKKMIKNIRGTEIQTNNLSMATIENHIDNKQQRKDCYYSFQNYCLTPNQFNSLLFLLNGVAVITVFFIAIVIQRTTFFPVKSNQEEIIDVSQITN